MKKLKKIILIIMILLALIITTLIGIFNKFDEIKFYLHFNFIAITILIFVIIGIFFKMDKNEKIKSDKYKNFINVINEKILENSDRKLISDQAKNNEELFVLLYIMEAKKKIIDNNDIEDLYYYKKLKEKKEKEVIYTLKYFQKKSTEGYYIDNDNFKNDFHLFLLKDYDVWEKITSLKLCLNSKFYYEEFKKIEIINKKNILFMDPKILVDFDYSNKDKLEYLRGYNKNIIILLNKYWEEK